MHLIVQKVNWRIDAMKKNSTPTSFRFSDETTQLLKQLAQDESRSITNMVESLIKEKSKAKEIGKLEAKLKV